MPPSAETSASPIFTPGAAVLGGRYRIQSLIGNGAFGEVYLATHLELDAPRALKVLRRDAPGLGSTLFNDFLDRFRLEAKLGSQLNHPNLVRVFDFIQEEDFLVLVLEYAPGGSLAERLTAARTNGKPFSIEQVLQWGIEIAEGLSAIHNLDAVHRDLKPSNILFDAKDHAKVADLGLAQVPGGPSLRSLLSEPRPHPGTPGFMSPEQEHSGAYLSPASDIYSLGLVLFECLTLRSYKSQRPGTPPSALQEEVPPWLDELLGRLLAEDPKGRPWNGNEAATALKTALNTALKIQSPSPPARQAPSSPLASRSGSREEPPRPVPQAPPLSAGQTSPSSDARPPAAHKPGRGWLYLGGAIAGLALLAFLITRLVSQASGAQAAWTPAPTQALQAVETSSSTPAVQSPTHTQPPEPAAIAETLAPTITGQVIALASSTVTPQVFRQASATATLTPAVPEVCAVAGAQRVSEIDGMALLCVPAGEFWMGSNAGDADEAPEHQVYLDAFWIDQTEVTNAMFQQFVAETGYQTEAERRGYSNVFQGSWSDVAGASWSHPEGPGSSIEGKDSHPVVHISKTDAAAYCSWAGRRLLSEAEWEKAARGEDKRKYPWGSSPDCSRAQYSACGSGTVAVGSFPAGASPYGALDMSGNVWEWVADLYNPGYYAISPASNPQGPQTAKSSTIRGGSWFSGEAPLRTSNRNGDDTAGSWPYLNGIRCGMSD